MYDLHRPIVEKSIFESYFNRQFPVLLPISAGAEIIKHLENNLYTVEKDHCTDFDGFVNKNYKGIESIYASVHTCNRLNLLIPKILQWLNPYGIAFIKCPWASVYKVIPHKFYNEDFKLILLNRVELETANYSTKFEYLVVKKIYKL